MPQNIFRIRTCWRLLSVGSLLLVALIASFALSKTPTALAASTVTANYAQPGNALVRYNQAISTIQLSNGSQDDQLIKNLGMKLERTFWSPFVWAQAGLGKYDWYAQNPFSEDGPQNRDWGSDAMLDNIIAQGAQPVVDFAGTPAWDASCNTSTCENGVPTNLTSYKQLVVDGLNHLRGKYPNLQYISVYNEPYGALSLQQYETIYQTVAQGIQVVNAALPQGKLPFLIGGPVILGSWQTDGGLRDYFTGFLTFVKNNNLPLDYLDWHEYGSNTGTDGAQIAADAQTIRGWLATAGLSQNIPQFVSEWGYDVGSDNPTPLTLMKSATYIAQGWSALETSSVANLMTPFPFAETDYAGYNRSVLAPYQVTTADGQVFPLYNVYKMMSMQKNTLVSVSGDTSLSPIATEDGSGVALMLTNTAGSTVTANLNNLPAAFQKGSFTFQEYLVDQTHSNWEYNQSTQGLQQVANVTENAASSFSTTLSMSQFSVALIVLTPGGGGGGNLVQDSTFGSSSSLSPYWSVSGSPQSSGVDTGNGRSGDGDTSCGYLYSGGNTGTSAITQTVSVQANTNYTLSGYLQDSGFTTGGELGVKTTGGTVIAQVGYGNDANYTQYSVNFNSGSNTSVVVFGGYTTPSSGGSWIHLDDVSLTASGNLVQDGDFGASNSLSPYWSVAGSPAASGVDNGNGRSGDGNTSCGYLWSGSNSGWAAITQTITVQTNTNYTLTAWLQTSGFNTGGELGIKTTGGTVIAQTGYGNDANYTQITVTFNSGSNTSVVIFGGYTTPTSGASWIHLDDVSV